jgi:hypothetical protein
MFSIGGSFHCVVVSPLFWTFIMIGLAIIVLLTMAILKFFINHPQKHLWRARIKAIFRQIDLVVRMMIKYRHCKLFEYRLNDVVVCLRKANHNFFIAGRRRAVGRWSGVFCYHSACVIRICIQQRLFGSVSSRNSRAIKFCLRHYNSQLQIRYQSPLSCYSTIG